MSGTSDPRLDALLRDLPPPPVPAGLAARVLAAAAAAPQEARPAHARRNARDRRGKWLRRPLLVGTAALGLVFTSAVAATLAGVPIPQKIAAVLFPESKAPEPKQEAAAVPRRASRPAPAAAAPVETAQAAPVEMVPAPSMQPNPWRRLFMAERMIAARRAMGLPTPGADRLARQLRHRAQMWDAATPEQRQAWIQREQLRQDVRRAMLSTPEGREQLARQDRMQRWRGQRPAPFQLSPEQRAARQQLVREWRARRMAGIPLSREERELRQERQLMRAARQGRWQAPPNDSAAAVPVETEGPPAPGR